MDGGHVALGGNSHGLPHSATSMFRTTTIMHINGASSSMTRLSSFDASLLGDDDNEERQKHHLEAARAAKEAFARITL
ncbi:hypothetical protein CBOM_05487 [Ceraceosorus bombacis]|uniref:Uncharacterized protein n=1 Tax=Ceraceosorus bombacis TaxID=401625 RepID=A0A0P1BQN4_9BASI|nr:hypothetical protein CBOM_05487 [Ceraceosorus bombacis]